MRIYSAKQIKEWEQFHLQHYKLDSYDLMHKASLLVANWIDKKLVRDDIKICIIVGKGNNGGDGYTVAQILLERGLPAMVFDLAPNGGSDLRERARKLYQGDIHPVQSIRDLQSISSYQLCIDAILGIGLDRPIAGFLQEVIEYINEKAQYIMSIDIPSGLYSEGPTTHTTIMANETCTFTCPKRSFYSSTNADHLGLWVLRDLDLSANYHERTDCKYHAITKRMVKPLIQTRPRFAHKGTFGHCLIIGSSINMAGAIGMSGKAALRCGSGLVSLASSEANRIILQSQVPEAMFVNTGDKVVDELDLDLTPYNVVAVGPGLGRAESTKIALSNLISSCRIPVVLDADAINIIAELDMVELLSPNTIITPHPKEFDRLFGQQRNDFDRRQIQLEMSIKHSIYIVLKGAYTTITTPDGLIYYNQTGNPGMAVGGSGDILTGMICSFVGQGYSHLDSCILGVYLHGSAGDQAAKDMGEEFMISPDIISYLSLAFKMAKS